MKTTAFLAVVVFTMLGCASIDMNLEPFANTVLSDLGKSCGVVNLCDFSGEPSVAKNNEKALNCAVREKRLGNPFLLNEEVCIVPDSWISSSYIFTDEGKYVLYQSYEMNGSGIQFFIGYCESVIFEVSNNIEGVSCVANDSLFDKYQKAFSN